MALSSTDQDKATRTLKQWLENDKRVVTYRDISREIGCHVNSAKNMLLSYHTTHAATATYLLTGPLLRTSTLTYTQLPPTAPASPTTATQSLAHLGGQVKIVDMDQMSDDERNSEVDEAEDDVRMTNDDGALDEGAMGIKQEGAGNLQTEEVPRWGVVMVSEEGLEEKKKLFEQDKLSIHVYALSPSPVKDPGQYLVSNLSLRTKDNYHNSAVYGTISGEGFKAAPEVMRDGGIDFGAKKPAGKKAETSPAPAPAKTAMKEEPKKKEAPKAKIDPAVKAEPVEPKSTAKAAGKRRSKSPEKSEPAASGSKKAASSSAKSGPTSSQNRHDEQAAMEAMMGMDMDQDFNMDDDDEGDGALGSEPGGDPLKSTTVKQEPGTVERKRKRRIVKKSKMEMDDKGYMVTKDYDTEESYSGESDTEQANSTAAKPKPAAKSQAAKVKAAPPPSAPSRTGSSTSVDSDKKPNISKAAPSAGLKKGAGGQSTLQGFFKKK